MFRVLFEYIESLPFTTYHLELFPFPTTYLAIGSLHDPVTWYKITHAGEQVAQWDFQNKGSSRWTGSSCIVLEVPLRNLHTSMCDFVPCDQIVQRAYFELSNPPFLRNLFDQFYHDVIGFSLAYAQAIVFVLYISGTPPGWLGGTFTYYDTHISPLAIPCIVKDVNFAYSQA